jgi:hypothetical protein
MLVMVPEDMFAHKLMAMYERSAKQVEIFMMFGFSWRTGFRLIKISSNKEQGCPLIK